MVRRWGLWEVTRGRAPTNRISALIKETPQRASSPLPPCEDAEGRLPVTQEANTKSVGALISDLQPPELGEIINAQSVVFILLEQPGWTKKPRLHAVFVSVLQPYDPLSSF